MSLLLAGALAAAGFVVARWAMRGRPRVEGPPSARSASTRSGRVSLRPPSARASSAPLAPDGDLFAKLPCRLGDVILRAGGEEAWLAAALVFCEDAPIAALFVAPEVGADRGIYVRAGAGDLLWLAPIAPEDLTFAAEPPAAIEHRGVWFERKRRLPVRIERAGADAPDVGARGILAEYLGPGAERVVAVSGPGVTRAWRGEALEEGLYEVLPGGRTSLGDAEDTQ